LLYLKGKGIGFVPRVEFVGEDYFVYRFIEGKPFKRVQKELSPKELRYFLKVFFKKTPNGGFCFGHTRGI